ncbi:hypothetical protein MNBD_NITROSPINAE02-1735 [hydrothermal vent metagenome]|uniref:histidine kinase n=1 Tax=hydrothermal vent metagenome TaxID=652676 RepID=A0A3B1CIK9_9ZZZZ
MKDIHFDRYQNAVSVLNRTNSGSDLESVLGSVLKDILGLLGFSSGAIRIKTSYGEADISVDSHLGGASLCFDDLSATECACLEALESSGGVAIEIGELKGRRCAEAGFRSVIAIPVPVGGIMLAVDKEEKSASKEAMSAAGQVCHHIGETVERIRESLQERELARDLETVNSVGRLVTSKLNLSDMTKEIVEQIGKVLQTDEVNVIMYDEKKKELSFLARYFANGSELDELEIYPLSDGINSWIIKTRQTLLMTYNTEEECEKLGIRHGGKPALSWLGAPMIYKDRVMGVLSVQSYRRKGLYGARSKKLLEIVAAQCAVAVENSRLFEEVISREKEKEWLYFSLTHDLRSLVSPVAGFARLIQATGPGQPQEESQSLLKGIVTSSEKLTRFVDDILVYSKIKSGKLVLNVERADVMRCVESAITLNMPEFTMRKLAVLVNGERPKLGAVTFSGRFEADFDVAQIERALLNLISNAVKHATSRIEVTLRLEGRMISCQVEDDGPGISQEMCEAVFDEYYQANSRIKGVGLGLPTVRKLVEMHHGSIRVHSKPGEGFSAKFSWPRTLADRTREKPEAINAL